MKKVGLSRRARWLSRGVSRATLALAGAMSLTTGTIGTIGAIGAGCADVSVTREGIPPEVSGVQPAKGPSAGGTPVIITGERFESGATVRFGGELATGVKWIDDKTINVIAPPGVGSASVSVENPTHLVGTLEDAFTYDGEIGGCAIVSSLPDFGASEVPVVGGLKVSFNVPVDVASLQGKVKLTLLGGGEVPADVKLDASNDSDVLVSPKKSLRFWGSYAIVVDEGVKAADGSACAPGAVAFATIKPRALPRALRPAPISGLALAGTSIVAASEGYRGLQTYTTAGPDGQGGAALKSDLVTTFGPRGLVIRGSRAYAPSGYSGVQIFDVSTPEAPVLLGHGGTPGRANDVAVIEKDNHVYLVVADIAQGVRVLDATDPLAVQDLGVLDLADQSPLALYVDAQGDTVAVADNTRIVLMHMPDPTSPGKATMLGSLDTGFGLSDILLDNGRVYVAKTLWGIASYDISNPAAIKLIDTQEDPDGPCTPGCLDAASTLVKDGAELFAAFGRGGVVRFSVDAAGKMKALTNYKVPGNVHALAVTPKSVMAGGEEGLLIFDRFGDGSAPAWFDPNGHGVAHSVAVKGGYAYVGASVRGVQTFSLADPEAPELVDRDDTPASLTADVSAYGVATGDKVLAVGDGRAGITLFDVSDPKNPVLGGTVDTTDALTGVVQAGSITYGCNSNGGVVAVDTTDPKNPKQLGVIDLSDVKGPDSCAALLPAGDLLYVGRRAGLGVLDVKDPTNLSWKNVVTMPGKEAVVSLAWAGKHILAASSVFDYEGTNNTSNRLCVFDPSDPSSPALVWSSDDLGGTLNLSVAGDIAFVAAGGGMKVFDVSDITSPVLEGFVDMPGNVSACAAGSGVVYAAQGAGGLQTIFTGPLPQSK